jgi:phospho-N-acetylmuramoyl-pentapeptide-transferase
MLIYLIDWLEKVFGNVPGAGLFDYITFRAGFAVIISLLISMFFGKQIIDYLRKLQIGESVRELGLEGQKQKQGTPTMGGLIIIMAILIPCFLVARLDNVYIILMILTTVWIGLIGFIDDYIKVFKNDKKGLKGKFKIMGQVGLGLLVALTFVLNENIVVRLGPGRSAGDRIERRKPDGRTDRCSGRRWNADLQGRL